MTYDLVEKIIDRLKEQGYAQGKKVHFGFISDDGRRITVSRENGQDTYFKRRCIDGY